MFCRVQGAQTSQQLLGGHCRNQSFMDDSPQRKPVGETSMKREFLGPLKTQEIRHQVSESLYFGLRGQMMRSKIPATTCLIDKRR